MTISKLIIIGLLVMALASCSSPLIPSETEIIPPSEPTWQFEAQPTARGQVIPTRLINLSFPISGRLVALSVAEGDQVKSDDVIARLDTTQLVTEVELAEADLAVAQADLEIVVAQTHLADQQGEILPEQIGVAQAQVEQAKASLQAAKTRRDQAFLVAPLDGTVTDIFIQTYEFAGIGQPVVQIADLNDLSVEVQMDELDMTGIDIGNRGVITFEALPGVQVEGVVTSIVPNTEKDKSGTFLVKYQLLQVPPGVRWGITANVFPQ